MKYKVMLCTHGGMQQLGVRYWEIMIKYYIWISVRSLLAIEILHELAIRSIEFLLAFTHEYLYADLSMEIHLGIGVDGNIG